MTVGYGSSSCHSGYAIFSLFASVVESSLRETLEV